MTATVKDGIYRTVYEIHKKWLPYPATLGDWERLTEDLNQACRAFKGDELCKAFSIAVYNELERNYREAVSRGEAIAV